MLKLASIVVPAVVPALFILIGWFVSQSQYLEQDRRQIRSRYMLDTYQDLYRLSCHDIKTMEDGDLNLLISTMGTISVFGTEEQIELLEKFYENLAKVLNNEKLKDYVVPFRYLLMPIPKDPLHPDIQPEHSLLRSLRDELGNELGMEDRKEQFVSLFTTPECALKRKE